MTEITTDGFMDLGENNESGGQKKKKKKDKELKVLKSSK
jgi:hypothetical protein